MKKVPFFANTPDDTHCVQASFRIMLKYFMPDREFSYQRLEKMSGYMPGKGTWWPPMLIELVDLGYSVKCIEGFDYSRFDKEGENYVKRLYRPETAEYYLEHSNLAEIRPIIGEFLKKVDVEARPANFNDINNLLENDWLVGIDLNAAVLNDLERDDYLGHMVVIFDRQSDDYWLHDPGLKPMPNRRVSRQKLSDAWFWSGPETAGLVALKLNGIS